jgi:hypothetical protein
MQRCVYYCVVKHVDSGIPTALDPADPCHCYQVAANIARALMSSSVIPALDIVTLVGQAL